MRGIAAALCVTVVACTSSPKASDANGGSCEALGYLAPTGSACPKGMCLASDAPEPCCGSICATCEAKGLVSTDDAGACAAGLCVSNDLIATLHCCDVCPGGADAGTDAGQGTDAGFDAASTSDASEDAPSDAPAD